MQCSTLIGEGGAIVYVEFTIDSDADLTITEVDYEGVNILPCLTEDQLEDLSPACFKAAEAEYKESLFDRGQELYEERMAYP